MTLVRFRKILPLALATASLAIAPTFAAKGGKAQVINWRMTPTAANLNAKGKIQFTAMPGKERFNLTAHALAAGAYNLNLDGATVATFQVSTNGNGGSGKLRLKAKKGNLGFNPRGGELTVSVGGADVLTASFPDCEQEAEDGVEVEADLVSTDVVPGATGQAQYESEEGSSEFEIEVQNLPAGTYDLVVGGTLVGSIVVGVDGEGHVEFTTEVEDQDDDGVSDNDPLLTFDPLGQLIQVSQSGISVLEVTFPTAPATGVCDDEGDDDQGDDDQGDDDQGENVGGDN